MDLHIFQKDAFWKRMEEFIGTHMILEEGQAMAEQYVSNLVSIAHYTVIYQYISNFAFYHIND